MQPTWFDGPSVPNSLFSMKVHLSNGNGQNATTGNANDSDSDDTIVLGQSEENTMERDDFDEFDLSNLCDDDHGLRTQIQMVKKCSSTNSTNRNQWERVLDQDKLYGPT